MNLSSTQEYSLSQLFSTPNRRIIIPDFQRDYCWGDKTHGEKHDTDVVSSFLDTLIEEFNNNQNSDVLLGKIDVYEHPKNHIYLTDGQQRLTSLYLIIGMLYRQEQDEGMKKRLKSSLLSDFEENEDGKEPYLQYAVRESTLFFLKDLVNEFFIGTVALLEENYRDAKSKKLINNEETLVSFTIKNQSWYFNEYDLDPSIISILSALGVIESKLKNLGKSFSEFIIDNVKIQYYDVKDKKHGEERFVIINTTGKGLTVSENIKPILLGNIKENEFANQWEERETWFWKNKKDNENIADNGVNEFLTWCFQIIEKQDEIDIVKKAKQLLKDNGNKEYLNQIQNYFDSLLNLLTLLENKNIQRQIQFINDGKEVGHKINFRDFSKEKQQNFLLPLIAFILKFENDKEGIYQFLRRLRKNYFDQKWEDRKHNYIDWRYILQIIEKSNSAEQVLSFETNERTIDKIQNVELNNWYNEEEKIKAQLKEIYKEKIEEWEDHPDFMGDLSFVLKATLVTNESNEIPDISSQNVFLFDNLDDIFKNYVTIVDLIREEDVSAEKNPKLANMFRLFRLFIGCDEVGHIYRASWEFEGVLFSTLNREHLFKVEFMKLLKSDDVLNYCIAFNKKEIIDNEIFNLTDFNVAKFIKAWLSLKVFYANQKNVLLAFYDGNETGVAAYIDKNRNKLIDDEEFSLTNSICGFGVRSGFGAGNYVRYTNEDLWNKANIIDSPFSAISFEEKDRTKAQLEKNKEIINSVIQSICS